MWCIFMTEKTKEAGRTGQVLRVLAHGTVIIWDTQGSRSYPYYKAGQEEFGLDEEVVFVTDATDTVVMSVKRANPPGKRKVKEIAAHKTDEQASTKRAA
jgi:hypothetical protein